MSNRLIMEYIQRKDDINSYLSKNIANLILLDKNIHQENDGIKWIEDNLDLLMDQNIYTAIITGGEIRIYKPEDLVQELPATHGPGFGPLVQYIRKFLPEIEIYILAVQPEITGLMVPMSAPVEAAIEKIVVIFKENPV